MSSAVLAATPIARAEPRFVIEASPLSSVYALRAYRECVTELCALTGVSDRGPRVPRQQLPGSARSAFRGASSLMLQGGDERSLISDPVRRDGAWCKPN